MLKVALRNRIHSVLEDVIEPRGFEKQNFLVGPYQTEQVADALADLSRGHKEATTGQVVAALTFSFWTTMLEKPYENLWQTTLHRIARRKGMGLRRKYLSGPLTPIRLLRNSIAHHEPILAWGLSKHHASMVQITE